MECFRLFCVRCKGNFHCTSQWVRFTCSLVEVHTSTYIPTFHPYLVAGVGTYIHVIYRFCAVIAAPLILAGLSNVPQVIVKSMIYPWFWSSLLLAFSPWAVAHRRLILMSLCDRSVGISVVVMSVDRNLIWVLLQTASIEWITVRAGSGAQRHTWQLPVGFSSVFCSDRASGKSLHRLLQYWKSSV